MRIPGPTWMRAPKANTTAALISGSSRASSFSSISCTCNRLKRGKKPLWVGREQIPQSFTP